MPLKKQIQQMIEPLGLPWAVRIFSILCIGIFSLTPRLFSQPAPLVLSWTKPQPGWVLLLDAKQGRTPTSNLWLIDPVSGRTMGQVNTTGIRPDFLLSHKGDRIYFAFDDRATSSRWLTTIDAASGTVISKVKNPNGIGWDTPAAVHLMALSSDDSFIYSLRRVSTPPEHDEYFLAVYDSRLNVFLDPPISLGLCSGPLLVPLQAAGKLLSLCGGTTSREIEFDSHGALTSQVDIKFSTAEDAAAQSSVHGSAAISAAILTPDGSAVHLIRRDGRLVTVNGDDLTVSELARAGALIGWIPYRTGAISSDSTRLYLPAHTLGNYEGYTSRIFAVDTASAAVVDTISPSQPIINVALSGDGSKLYASTNQGLLIISTASKQEVGFVRTGGAPSLLEVVPIFGQNARATHR